ncbi:PhzF family phenazine biosynthesis protein [Aspergillus fischeri NRRL 181]|uniref:Phenazine biosynthesis-like protein n=1 Tax=Neosartorya fischeri (strain ATCC 1020 / DSM 3700 / CBS 544.65 / FGSC A1164 / JCM 1740 / NRRL 181 / WB 181) TaxID=331117 RepID=A1DNQ6_NEOFI|nr:phenazine biosynthesis-like protein [Aspergillus fischeri NRRL 181]EAW16427.1 phenazine biosynthesis-like protein [Aspergillus fischeri NRRL 181]
MSQKSAPFVTVDVFTAESFSGNQLAIVKVGKESLSKEQKQKIAREFNFSETVFLYDDDPSQSPRVDIFTPVNEMDFAGHPVIGTGHVLFRNMFQQSPVSTTDGQEMRTLITKAGPVTIRYDRESRVVSAEIPHDIHTHSKFAPAETLLVTQSSLRKDSNAARLQTGYPVVSIVKGVTYVLADFTNFPDLFASVSASASPTVDLDDGWSPSFTGTMYYRRLGAARMEQDTTVQDLRVRMIAINLEDPACGSGSAALATFLALQDGKENGKYRFNFDQGSEIGRQSYITVEVHLNGRGDGVSTILLAGEAALVTNGWIRLPE